jgi:hypothetical protein
MKLPTFQNAKQIIEECQKIISEEDEEGKLWNFRELLSWKVPEHLSLNPQK